MSSLQLGLLVAGGVTLLAVVLYNQWVSRRSAPRQAENAEPVVASEPEPLTEPSAPVEPVLEDYFRNLFRTRDIPFPLVTNWSRDLAQLSLESWDDDRIESVRLASAQWYRDRKREVRSRVHAALFKAFQRDAAPP